MHLESAELTELWKLTDRNMQSPAFAEKLRLANYSQKNHARFSDMIKNTSNPDGAPTAIELTQILIPLKNAYHGVIEIENNQLANIGNSSSKVATLFPQRPNPQVSRLKAQHEEAACGHKANIRLCSKALELIDFVLADPRLKQTNPALTGRSLDY